MKHQFLIRIGMVLAVSSLCGFFTAGTFAHPASGIVVNAKGEVFFVHSGKGACQIQAQGGLTYLHKDTGGHFLALDTEGKFSSSAGNRLFQGSPLWRQANPAFRQRRRAPRREPGWESLLRERISRRRRHDPWRLYPDPNVTGRKKDAILTRIEDET